MTTYVLVLNSYDYYEFTNVLTASPYLESVQKHLDGIRKDGRRYYSNAPLAETEDDYDLYSSKEEYHFRILEFNEDVEVKE
jgi:hypothetical protein